MPKGKMIKPQKADIKEKWIETIHDCFDKYRMIFGAKDFRKNVLESYFDKKSQLWTTGESEIC